MWYNLITMKNAIKTLTTNPTQLMWWQWGKLIGAVTLVALLVALTMGMDVHHIIIAITLHIALDFSLQTNTIAMHKHERKTALLVHAIIVGGIPAIVTGSLVGIALGIITHYAIDYTRKFGLNETHGAIADQLAHVLVLVTL